MTEGTKIGEFKDNNDFNPAVKRESDSNAGGTATKIGEVSDFEKSLINEADQSDAQVEVQETAEQAPSAEKIENTAPAQEAAAPAPAPVVAESQEEPSDSGSFFEDELDRLVVDYQEGDIVQGTVRSVEKGGILVDIRYKSDGYVSNSEFSNNPEVNPSDAVKPGDEISVFIVKLESKEGYTVLSKKRADYEMAWSTLAKYAKSKDIVEVRVSSKVQGGLVAEYEGIKGFIPASQVSNEADTDLDGFVGQTLQATVLQSDRRRRKVIFSHKQVQSKSQRENRDAILAELEVGQVRDGKVTSVKDFGVFVDLGGIEGLVHISELSWSRVSDPSKIVQVGQEVKVFVLGVDRETRRISLGMKQLEVDPWVKVSEKYSVGQVVNGSITRLTNFGAFIQIEDNLEGLIHISELSFDHVNEVADVVKPGQQVEAKIIKLIPEEQKIGLSLKGVGESEEEAKAREERDAERKREREARAERKASRPKPTVNEHNEVVLMSANDDVEENSMMAELSQFRSATSNDSDDQ